MTAQAIVGAFSDRGVRLRIIEGDQIAFRPRNRVTAALKAELVAHKPDVLAWLTEEIAWRVAVMQSQAPPYPEPMPPFRARPALRPGRGRCASCGDPVPPDPTGPGAQRCGLCVEAIWRLLEVRAGADA